MIVGGIEKKDKSFIICSMKLLSHFVKKIMLEVKVMIHSFAELR